MNVYGKYNHTDKKIDLGGSYNVKGFVDRAALNFNLAIKDGAIGDKTYTFATEKKLDDNTTVKAKVDVKDTVSVTGCFIHKVNQNFKLRVADTINPLQAW